MSSMVKKSAVARFMGIEPEDVDRLARLHGLPVVSIPGRTRPGVRIFKPDFHRWLVARGGETARELRDYQVFSREFDDSGGQRSAVNSQREEDGHRSLVNSQREEEEA